MKRNVTCRVLLAVIVLLVVGYAGLVEPNRIVIRRVVIEDSVLARAWPGLTVVHLSDLHIERMGAREERVLAMVRELHPDLIALSGDYTQWQADPAPAQQFLARLSAPLGVIGVLGDADLIETNAKGCTYCHPAGRYHERIEHPCLLQNESRRIALRGGTIEVAGVDLGGAGVDGWLERLQAKSRQTHEPLIILSHRSTLWSRANLASHSLWLSGDTHGGQVWVPDLVWRMISRKPDPEHRGGVYTNDEGGWLIVNRGIGTTGRFPFRLGVPPEVLVITFVEGQG